MLKREFVDNQDLNNNLLIENEYMNKAGKIEKKRVNKNLL